MSLSKVVVSDEGIAVAQKFQKHHGGVNFASFKFSSDMKSVVLDHVLSSEESSTGKEGFDLAMSKLLYVKHRFFTCFLNPLLFRSPSPSFVLVKIEYESITDKTMRSASAMIMYVPNGSSIKEKMLATMSAKPVSMILNGGMTIQACSVEEASYESILGHILARKSVK